MLALVHIHNVKIIYRFPRRVSGLNYLGRYRGYCLWQSLARFDVAYLLGCIVLAANYTSDSAPKIKKLLISMGYVKLQIRSVCRSPLKIGYLSYRFFDWNLEIMQCVAVSYANAGRGFDKIKRKS